MREFGELLRTHRIHAGLTQQQLADFAMVSVRAIRDLECGRTRTPRAETVRLLADGLRLDDTSRADLAQAGGRPAVKAGVAPPAPAASIVGREAETAALVALLVGGAAKHQAAEGWRGAPAARLPVDARLPYLPGDRQRLSTMPYPADDRYLAEDRHAGPPSRPATAPDGPRLVTITGVSGVGKTRLALEAAGELHFRHGWSVLWHLASLPSIDDEQDTVLVTDRCPDPRLLTAHPRLRILVTAPAPTGLAGEHVFPLAALPDEAAVRLLLTHVHRVRPGFRAEPANQAALTGLVKALDGLPSALEFAAGWFMVYSPQHLLERLRSNPMDPTSAHLRDALRRSLSTLDEEGRRTLADVMEGRESRGDLRALSVRGLVRNVGGRYEVLNLVRAAAMEPVPEPHFAGGVPLTWPC